MRLVGLTNSKELDGLARSTTRAKDSPKISICSLLAPLSGKCIRVPEATPSVAWQSRQFAASRTGYNLVAKELGSVAGLCAQPADQIHTKPASASKRDRLMAAFLLPIQSAWASPSALSDVVVSLQDA